VLADFVEVVELVEPNETRRVVMTDPDDDDVIAAAIAGRADFVVSGDRDLLSLARFEGVLIVTAAQAVQHIGKQAK
jgi:predicted nucleic acid-binding protein